VWLLAAAVVAALLAASASAPARADSSTEGLLNDRFVISVGGFVVTSSINASLLGSANTSEQSIDFDKQFGTDPDQTRWRGEVLSRITPTQHVRFSYFDSDLALTRSIDKDLPWGDYTFEASAQVAAETKFRVYELNYEFAFLRRSTYEIVVIAGIHLDDLTLKLSGNASLTVDTPTGAVDEAAVYTATSHSIPAPLQSSVFGETGQYRRTCIWTLPAKYSRLAIRVSMVIGTSCGLGRLGCSASTSASALAMTASPYT
jgi:hypothetical protein